MSPPSFAKYTVALVALVACGRSALMPPFEEDAGFDSGSNAEVDSGRLDAGLDAGLLHTTPTGNQPDSGGVRVDAGIAVDAGDPCGQVMCGPNERCGAGGLCGCLDGYSLDGGVCVLAPNTVVPGLSGLRWELPCLDRPNNYVCGVVDQATQATTVTGSPGRLYDITVHIRGVVEAKEYAPNPIDSGVEFIANGVPVYDAWNIYSLRVSNPSRQYYLNQGQSALYRCWAADYVATFRAGAGATITLSAQTVENRQIRNIDDQLKPFIPPGVPPAPAIFDGQFLQLDVVSISTVP